jgi:hypothetical protein
MSIRQFFLKRKEWVILGFLLLIGFAARIYKIQEPLGDWHSFRQADTASVTREYLKNGIDLLKPRYHDLSNIQSGKDNLEGYRMVEFPLLNAVTAVIIQSASLFQYEELVGRSVSVAYSMVSIVALFLLVRKISGNTAATIATFAFSIMPYAVYYSRVILPEPAMVASMLVSLTAWVYWTEKKKPAFWIVATLSMIEALLLKPYVIFLLPLFAYTSWRKGGFRELLSVQSIIFFVGSITPLIWWRNWITQFPEGIPVTDWLFNKNGIRFTGAFFHWLFEVRIGTLILGIGLVALAVFGLLRKGKDVLWFWIWAACMLAYLSVFASGNVQHDYYQVMLMPMLCAIVGRGAAALLHLPKSIISRPIALGMIGILFAWSFSVSWYTIRDYYNINHWEIVEAGKAVDRLLPKDAKIIAPYMGDTAFLYQTKRRGWPLGFDIQKKIDLGAQYYVSVNMDDEANELSGQYIVLEKTDKYVIIDLQKKW